MGNLLCRRLEGRPDQITAAAHAEPNGVGDRQRRRRRRRLLRRGLQAAIVGLERQGCWYSGWHARARRHCAPDVNLEHCRAAERADRLWGGYA